MAIYDNQNTAVVIFAKGEYTKEIQKDNLGVSTTPPNVNPPNDNEQSPMKALKQANEEISFNLKDAVVGLGVLRASKSFVNYAKNNYGDIMQDSVAQTRINEAFSVIGMGASIGMGFATGGIVGGTAMIVGTATQLGLQAITRQRQLHRSNVVSQVNMFRVGESALNGGR